MNGNRKVDSATPSEDRQDIVLIVRETINALDGKKSVIDGYAYKQREEIVRALTDCKGRVAGADGAAARLE